eukprot:CAMPEP_0172885830 /NCGR_PEP_ID=MMETSP1075-20121228/129235_1 /TAXON_ID=2916 /ORGANISM="Ceratium fusus, Strain PA161109" /LENGTH=73 /DNA_ID=CAMNT_0013739209 /DNA_START=111 /DNA_END=332 /DNA_ORIENTATION=+
MTCQIPACVTTWRMFSLPVPSLCAAIKATAIPPMKTANPNLVMAREKAVSLSWSAPKAASMTCSSKVMFFFAL